MRLLFVHERFGALGGAEANVLLTATELKRRGHAVGLLHGTATGKEEAAWQETFAERFALGNAAQIARSVHEFRPDVIFLHKLSELNALEALASCGVPVIRMVHDHDLYCLRGYKYNPLNRQICTRAASPFCVFPCAATIGRKPGGGFPLKWVSYGAKRREIEINRRFHRLIA